MQFLRIHELTRTTGFKSLTTIRRQIREGIFPRGVAIGDRAKGWPQHEVEQIQRARMAGASKADLQQIVASLHEQRKTIFRRPGAQ